MQTNTFSLSTKQKKSRYIFNNNPYTAEPEFILFTKISWLLTITSDQDPALFSTLIDNIMLTTGMVQVMKNSINIWGSVYCST